MLRAVEGAVCWRTGEVEECTASDAAGNFELLEVPAHGDGAVYVDADIVVPAVMPLVLGSEDLNLGFGLDSPYFLAERYAEAEVEMIPGRATVCVGTSNPSAGNTVSISPGGWEGPFFLNYSGRGFDLEATTTGNSGIAYFLGVDPAAGPYTVDARTAEGEACTGTINGEVLPATITPAADSVLNVGVRCP